MVKILMSNYSQGVAFRMSLDTIGKALVKVQEQVERLASILERLEIQTVALATKVERVFSVPEKDDEEESAILKKPLLRREQTCDYPSF